MRGARGGEAACLGLALAAALTHGCGEEAAAPSEAPASTGQERAGSPATARPRADFALVLHGGAGAPPRDLDPARRAAYVRSLAGAVGEGCRALDGGASSLDVVEGVVRTLEDDPLFNAGKGAVMTRERRHELDASIMDGRDLSCGAVASVTTVRNPVSLARAVMERTRHVLLVGEGAERFAEEIGMQPVPNGYFTTEGRRDSLERQLASEVDEKGTVGAVALDRHGNLAAATSTGGLSGKRWGRVGDSPIVGAGTYADNRSCAVSGTGTGEEFIRHGVAHSISDRMRLAGETVQQAAEALVHRTLREGDGGVIALSSRGETAMVFNTGGMFRARCVAGQAPEVWIWEDPEPLPAE